MSRRLLILGWHNVEGTWAFPSKPGEGTRGLRRQLSFLRRAANVVALDRALDDLAAGRPLPPRAVAVTFDDGYRDNLEQAVPLLEELGIPATIFLVSGVLDRSVVPWWERLGHAFAVSTRAELEWDGTTWPVAGSAGPSSRDAIAERLKQLMQDERSAAVDDIADRLGDHDQAATSDLFLDWDGARTLAARGVAIGAHSTDHAILANETAEAQTHNLGEARRALETGLDRPVDLFAYPNGTSVDFDERTVSAARAAGYRCAVTTMAGWNDAGSDFFALRRQVMHPEPGLLGFKPIVRRTLVELSARRAPT
jgi:peptidoglycan/xylan/chitin deacetylase (PgdA/CDA1 family)